MNTWRVVRVEAENFLCWEKLDWSPAATPGITLILGHRGPGRSNGSGKTSLIEAIVFALWGCRIRDGASSTKVRRRQAGPSAKTFVRVTIEVIGDDARTVVVERARDARGGSVRVSGLQKHNTIEGGDESIVGFFGDFASFKSTSLFAGATSSFCRLTDSERKAVLERMLQLDRFSGAEERAKMLADAAAADKAVLERTLPTSRAAVARLREDARRAGAQSLRALMVAARTRDELRERAKDAFTRAAEAQEVLLVEQRRIRAAQEQAAARKGALRAQEAAEQDVLDGHTEASRKAAVALGTARAKLDEIRREIQQLKAGKRPPHCPTCGQRWALDAGEDHAERHLQDAQRRLADAEAALSPLRAASQAADDAVAEAKEVLRSTRAAIAAVAAEVDLGAWRSAVADAAETFSQAEEYARRHTRLLRETPEEPDTAEHQRVLDELEEAKIAVEECEEAMAKATTTEAIYRYWRRAFQRSGIPSFLVDSSIPAMNEAVATVASALTDGELAVSFDPTATRGSSNVFAVRVDYRDGAEDFTEASRGEQTRVDVAVLFALRDLAERRGRAVCGQLFLDEIMDGADEHFAESFVRFVRHHYASKRVFMISHDQTVASLCDDVLTVKRKGNAGAVLKYAK